MDLRQVDLNLLVALDALLRERHVTRAAQRLLVSQPAMSASLARLRKLLDDPLLVRTGNVLQLTPFAEALHGSVRDILARVEQALTERPGFDPSSDDHVFSVAASDYITLMLLRPFVAQLAVLAPKVRLHIEPVLEDYAERIRQDRLDLLILPREVAVKVSEASSEPLFLDRFVAAAWAAHPDSLTEITRKDLETLPYLACRAHGLSSYVDKQLDSLGIERNVEMTTESFVIAPFLLRGTRLIAMIHQRLGRELAEVAEIRLMDPPVRLRPITQQMFWHPRRDNDPAHRWLREKISETARGIDASDGSHPGSVNGASTPM